MGASQSSTHTVALERSLVGIVPAATGAGDVATIAAIQTSTHQGLACDPLGDTFITATYTHRIIKLGPTPSVPHVLIGSGEIGATDGARDKSTFNLPRGLATDRLGNIFVADSGNLAVRLIDSNDQVRTLISGGELKSLHQIAVFKTHEQDHGWLYTTDPVGGAVHRLPLTWARDEKEKVNVVASGPWVLFASTAKKTAAGLPGVPSGICVDSRFGSVWVATSNGYVVRICPPEWKSAPASIYGSSQDIQYGSDDGKHDLSEGSGTVPRFVSPFALACDNNGNVFVADSGQHAVRVILRASSPISAHVCTVAGNGTPGLLPARGGMAKPMAGRAARLDTPAALQVDSDFRVWLLDGNQRILRIEEAAASEIRRGAGCCSSVQSTGDLALPSLSEKPEPKPTTPTLPPPSPAVSATPTPGGGAGAFAP